MAELVDAFLYLGPQDLRLNDQMPADIALDVDYRMELQRREALPGTPSAATGMPKQTLKEFDQQILDRAGNPLFAIHNPRDSKLPDPELSRTVQTCLDMKNQSRTTQ
jgi:hypothetical protein